MKIGELLDSAKKRANLPSDYALAKVLGLSAGNVSNIRKGRAHPSNEVAVKLATLAGLEEMRVIAEIELRTANSEKKKEFWKSFIENRGLAHSFGTIVLGISIITTPEPATANVLQLQNYDAHFYAHNTPDLYIMRISENKPSSAFQQNNYRLAYNYHGSYTTLNGGDHGGQDETCCTVVDGGSKNDAA